MTPQQINRAIAEFVGWKGIEDHPSDGKLWGQHPSCPDERNEFYDYPVPDYYNDLDAMHEAERTLTELQVEDYADHVADNSNANYREIQLLHATAAQRAEAFLRTIGKWEESK